MSDEAKVTEADRRAVAALARAGADTARFWSNAVAATIINKAMQPERDAAANLADAARAVCDGCRNGIRGNKKLHDALYRLPQVLAEYDAREEKT